MLTVTSKAPVRIVGQITLTPGMHAVVGPSGAGKTTLFRLISGLDRYPSHLADVHWQGRPIGHAPPYRRPCAYVPQHPSLIPHRPIADQVLWTAQHANGPWQAWIDHLHLQPYWRRLPGELSGGEQQRVALLRALAADQPILLLDEALSQIDRPHRLAIYRRLQTALAPDRFLLFSTHHWDEAEEFAQHMVFLENGQMSPPAPVADLIPATPSMAWMMGYLGTFPTPSGHILIHPRRIHLDLDPSLGFCIPGQGYQQQLSPTLSAYSLVASNPPRRWQWSGAPVAHLSRFSGITIRHPRQVGFDMSESTPATWPL